jgi:hypothetical protein
MASIGSGTQDLDLCLGIHISELLACIRSRVPYLPVKISSNDSNDLVGLSSFRGCQM